MPDARPPAFTYRKTKLSLHSGDSVLFCDEVPLPQLAKRYGTPLYVYSASAIRERVKTFMGAFPKGRHTLCYSVKANSNLSLLRMLARLGCGFDVVSGGELQRVSRAAPKALGKVVFSGVGKTREELQAALKARILLFNLESESEMRALAECARRMRRKAPVAFRVNPDVAAKTHPYISTGLHQHKFGVPIGNARQLYQQAHGTGHLDVCGVSVHIGSQITEVGQFAETMERVAQLVRELGSDGLKIRYVDAGGGLGIDYQNPTGAEFAAITAAYAKALLGPLDGLDLQLLLEPGRSIVGPAGALVSRVVYRKVNNGKRFLITDAAMNDLLRPSLYHAYHEIVPVERSDGDEARRETLDVVGPICETGDFFARDRELPFMEEGDLLAILDAGAYGMALSSNYNTRPRAAEVLVDGKTVKLIRRRETVRDLLAAER
jgi:diaminopimelate decarboxylase